MEVMELLGLLAVYRSTLLCSFHSVSLARKEEHMMEDGILSADGWTPPWKKSIQASVEWKRAPWRLLEMAICTRGPEVPGEVSALLQGW